VKRPVSTVVLGILNYTGRLLATLTAVVVFLLALGLVIKAHRLLLASQKGLNNPPPILVGNPAAAPAGNPAAHPFWPEFPRSDAGTFQSAVINGIQIMTEEWQCSNPPNDVLAYYRDQMTARGWQDVTEKTYNLQPELREGELAQGQPQDQTYINDYKKNMESKLALQHGQWSMNISTEPGKLGFGLTDVKIYAAATPFIKDFFMNMAASVEPRAGGAVHPLDAVQDNGSEHYHTTIVAVNESADKAFAEKLKEVEAQGWRPVMFLPKEKTPNGFFAWLVRGRQYAGLSVNALPQGKGSSVTLTEVTSEAGQK
jgi:hypothetical protein